MEKDKGLEELRKAVEEIWAVGERLGLDAFPTHFEIVPANIMYEFGAYGLPGRFSHWTHGKAYHRMKTIYDHGLSRIYELVVNTNPCYAFLLEGNSLVQNKLVIAHVMAHSDFFKNNVWFANTRRDMIEAASAHAERIDKYCFEHGPLEVEQFLDSVLAVQEHVDVHQRIKSAEHAADAPAKPPKKRPSTPYDDLWEREERQDQAESGSARRFPPEPEKDLLRFLAENAPDLQDWQRDCI
ncbi:MAG: SpoVR family protein, partial [Armatimonadota bacterium]